MVTTLPHFPKAFERNATMLRQTIFHRLGYIPRLQPLGRMTSPSCFIRCLSSLVPDGLPSLSPRQPVSYLPSRPLRIVIGITGATGTIYAIRLLEILKQLNIETHLVISKWALATLKFETPLSATELSSLASATYSPRDVSAGPASGSFQHDGMIIVPCSMKTLAAVRCGLGDDLIARAADVTLKEGRRLMLVVRETPLSDIHLENMLAVRRAGAIIFPPVPAFYTQPKSLDDMVNQSAGRMLDSMGIHVDTFPRWSGFGKGKV